MIVSNPSICLWLQVDIFHYFSAFLGVFVVFLLARLFFKTEEVLSPPARRRRRRRRRLRRLRRLRLRPVKF